MKVVGYTRVSTQEQAKDGWTLAQQRKDIEAECARRGWELVAVIEDAGYTGRNDNRPGLQHVLGMLASRGGPKAVVVARLDRLARSLVHLAHWIELSSKQGWSMVALDHELNTSTANGRLVARIIASVAQWESEINGERVRDGMAEARASLRASGQPVPFGFQPAQLHPKTVRRILAGRAAGKSYATLANELMASGIPAPAGGPTWHPSTVAGVYKREAATA